MLAMRLSTPKRVLGAVAATILIAVLALRAMLGGSGTPQLTDKTTSGGSHGAPSLMVVPDPAAEEIPGAHCWAGLLDIDRSASIATLRTVLARAVASGDELLATYVGDRLVELVGGDLSRAAELLDWAVTTSGKEAEVVFGALARTAAVQDPAIVQRLLRTGEDRVADEVRRASAIGALETQTRLAPDNLARVAAVALQADAGGAAWTATRTIGRVMKQDFTRTGEYAAYWEQLLDISARTKDPAVRILALEMPAYVDALLGPEQIADLAALLTTAPEREVREMAAFQLGLTNDSQRVLDVFRAAFPRERELCVRWAMIRFAVRAAGPRAMPLLEDLARIDRRFAVDVADFRRIYATGIEDFERVWIDKAEHHACSADGDEGAS
jgi:hypothetical protein